MAKNKASCPAGYTALAAVTVGKLHGHQAGNRYHDVDVMVSRSPHATTIYHVRVVETSGISSRKAGEEDEEGERKELIGRDQCLRVAFNDAGVYAATSGLISTYLVPAMSQALAKAELWLEREMDAELDAADKQEHAALQAELEMLRASAEAAFRKTAPVPGQFTAEQRTEMRAVSDVRFHVVFEDNSSQGPYTATEAAGLFMRRRNAVAVLDSTWCLAGFRVQTLAEPVADMPVERQLGTFAEENPGIWPQWPDEADDDLADDKEGDSD